MAIMARNGPKCMFLPILFVWYASVICCGENVEKSIRKDLLKQISLSTVVMLHNFCLRSEKS